MELGLAGRRALVTGGSKGIGFAVAAELLAEGAQVAICARNAGEVADAVDVLGPGCWGTATDVTDADQVAALVPAAAQALGGGLDILVNNAGAAHPGTFRTVADADLKADADVKLFSQIRCSRAALPYLEVSPAPRIVNVNAVYARYPDPAFFSTTVHRAACLALSKVLAQELGPAGVLVNSVNIGFVDTPQWENIRQRRAPELDRQAFFSRLAAQEVPLGRFGRADEVSGLVAFLASDRAGYITGASIDVAGGMGRYV